MILMLLCCFVMYAIDKEDLSDVKAVIAVENNDGTKDTSIFIENEIYTAMGKAPPDVLTIDFQNTDGILVFTMIDGSKCYVRVLP